MAFFLSVHEYFLDDDWIFDTGDHFDVTTARPACFDIDIENPFQALCHVIAMDAGFAGAKTGHCHPRYGRHLLLQLIRYVNLFASPGGCHPGTMFAVGGKNTMEPGKIHSRFGH